MNEDLHIEKAAHLADKPGAENLATDRARDFVAKALAAKEEEDSASALNRFVLKPVYAWSGVALALAACVAVAIVVFRPHTPGYGTPGTLQENQSNFASGDVLDSLQTESSDTLKVKQIVYPEE